MRISPAFLLVLSVFGAGCAKPESQLVGKWQVAPVATSTGNAQADAIAKQLSGTVVFEFKADKTFKVATVTGTYVVEGHTVTMTANGSVASSGGKPVMATLSDDGKTLTMVGGSQQIKFVKQAS